ncbi:MAG: peptidylprolyl isomerase [Candidatus Dependentiae bacterium ADurb.Bin331]|nr:MAG: peptidylprolyl isomerase [Candidatus Dependentiae bacterium ADurb.Bin331]
MRFNKSLQGALVVSLIVLLPQCDWGKKEEIRKDETSPASIGAGEVLLTIDGQPRITVDRFENYMNTVLEAQPQLKQLIGLMPDAEMELFRSMSSEELLQAWMSKNHIDQQENYKKDFQMIMDFGKRQLALKYFQEAHPIKISDAEVKKYYEENKKSIPELMTARGGISGMAIGFDKPEEAQAFFAKVKDPKADFVQLARDAKLMIKDLKEVNELSFDVDAPLRDKLITLKKMPAVEFVTGKEKTWVVKAVSKQDPQYVPYDQIKPRLEAFLQQQKMGEMFTAELENLKNEFKVVENKSYFERKKKLKEEEMNKMMEKTDKQVQADAQPAPAPTVAPIKGA